MVLPQAMAWVQYWFRILSLKFCGKSKKNCGDISQVSPAFCMYAVMKVEWFTSDKFSLLFPRGPPAIVERMVWTPPDSNPCPSSPLPIIGTRPVCVHLRVAILVHLEQQVRYTSKLCPARHTVNVVPGRTGSSGWILNLFSLDRLKSIKYWNSKFWYK